MQSVTSGETPTCAEPFSGCSLWLRLCLGSQVSAVGVTPRFRMLVMIPAEAPLGSGATFLNGASAAWLQRVPAAAPLPTAMLTQSGASISLD